MKKMLEVVHMKIKTKLKTKFPVRREHGCDGCKKDVATELFEGVNGERNVWFCTPCFKRLTE